MVNIRNLRAGSIPPALKQQATSEGKMNKKKTMHTVKDMFFDLKKDKDNMDDFANIAYDAGYMVALCIALNRKRVADKIYDYFLKNW